MRFRASLLTISHILAATSVASAAAGQEQVPVFQFDVPAQTLKYALRSVTRKAGLGLVATASDLPDRPSPELHGRFTAQAALDALLQGSGLQVVIEGKIAHIRGRAQAAPALDQAEAAPTTPIVVTGTHLEGVPVASPVITLTQQAMRDSGENSLPQALRDLPQNFGGGQNPAIGLAVSGSSNTSGASTINLRGLGGDATLTLLNGHRLSYNVNLQSIDISSIPFVAVDRVEIVADGASALYGSDAVAGVANIVLRHDYNGIVADAQIGGSTDGGGFQQQYGLLGGKRWSTGGFAAAYEFGRENAVEASDRSYARNAAPGLMLTPFLEHHSGVLTAHQDIFPGMTLSTDLLANTRWNRYHYALDQRGDYLLNGGQIGSKDSSFAIAPTIHAAIGSDWSADLAGMYGLDRNHYRVDTFSGGRAISTTAYCNCNDASSIEASVHGPLVHLPGGPIQLAVGGGYRNNRFSQSNTHIDFSQGVAYGFGELVIPIVSALNSRPGLRALSVSGAGRYEDYQRGENVTTPKLGIVYSPVEGLQLKGSWGKSFKAPTLFQLYNGVRVGAYAASALGSRSPAPATALLLAGGNPALRPERATSWSTGFVLQPLRMTGLHVEASYFAVNYRDRVVLPITYQALAFSSPAYTEYVTDSPSSASVDAALALGPLVNATGRPFNAANVVGIADGRYINAGHQRLHGVDAGIRYGIHVRSSEVNISGSATYLHSRQKLTPSQAPTDLSGTLFNPPHFRARGGVTWTNGTVLLGSFANYTGGVRDVRSTPTLGVASMTTWDMNGRYTLASDKTLLSGLELSLNIQSLLDRRPSFIARTTVYEQPYDATNYSPYGRVISFGLRMHL